MPVRTITNTLLCNPEKSITMKTRKSEAHEQPAILMQKGLDLQNQSSTSRSKDSQWPPPRSVPSSSRRKFKFKVSGGINERKVCRLCLKEFSRPSALKVHLISHCKERKFKCNCCHKAFKYKHQMSRHAKLSLNCQDTIPVEVEENIKKASRTTEVKRKLKQGKPSKLRTGVAEERKCDLSKPRKRKRGSPMSREQQNHTSSQRNENAAEVYQDKDDDGSLVTQNESAVTPISSKRRRISSSSQGEIRCLEPDCGKVFRNLCTLQNHMVAHSNARPYMCVTCEKTYKWDYNYNLHIQLNHPFKCDKCKLRFAYQTDLTHHLRVHTTDKQKIKNSSLNHSKVQYIETAKILPTEPKKINLPKDDDQETQNQNPYRRYIGKSYRRERPIQRTCVPNANSVARRTGRSSQGKVASKIRSAAMKQVKKQRRRAEKQETPLSEDVNNVTVTSQSKKHHGLKSVKCLNPDCKKLFVSVSTMRCHMVAHSNVRAYFCSICQRSYKWEYNFNMHVQQQHPFKCKKCKLCFVYGNHLKQHMLVHGASGAKGHGLKPKTGSTKPSMSRIPIRPSKRRPTKRNQASISNLGDNTDEPLARFSQRQRKLPDVSTNEYDAPGTSKKYLKCLDPECTKIFDTVATRSKHMVRHSNSRPHVCSTCQKGYKWEYNYNLHIKLQHPFKCDECQLAFAYPTDLTHHLSIHDRSADDNDKMTELQEKHKKSNPEKPPKLTREVPQQNLSLMELSMEYPDMPPKLKPEAEFSMNTSACISPESDQNVPPPPDLITQVQTKTRDNQSAQLESKARPQKTAKLDPIKPPRLIPQISPKLHARSPQTKLAKVSPKTRISVRISRAKSLPKTASKMSPKQSPKSKFSTPSRVTKQVDAPAKPTSPSPNPPTARVLNMKNRLMVKLNRMNLSETHPIKSPEENLVTASTGNTVSAPVTFNATVTVPAPALAVKDAPSTPLTSISHKPVPVTGATNFQLKPKELKLKHTCTCPTCAKVFLDSNILRLHMATHKTDVPKKEPEQSLRCTICHLVFETSYRLQRHAQAHLQPTPSYVSRPSSTVKKAPREDLRCEHCGKYFLRRNGLTVHVRSHEKAASKQQIQTECKPELHQVKVLEEQLGNNLGLKNSESKVSVEAVEAKPEALQEPVVLEIEPCPLPLSGLQILSIEADSLPEPNSNFLHTGAKSKPESEVVQREMVPLPRREPNLNDLESKSLPVSEVIQIELPEPQSISGELSSVEDPEVPQIDLVELGPQISQVELGLGPEVSQVEQRPEVSQVELGSEVSQVELRPEPEVSQAEPGPGLEVPQIEPEPELRQMELGPEVRQIEPETESELPQIELEPELPQIEPEPEVSQVEAKPEVPQIESEPEVPEIATKSSSTLAASESRPPHEPIHGASIVEPAIEEPKGKFECYICGKAATQLRHLLNHLKSHTEERPYKCDIDDCDRAFVTLRQLQLHHQGKCHTSSEVENETSASPETEEEPSVNVGHLVEPQNTRDTLGSCPDPEPEQKLKRKTSATEKTNKCKLCSKSYARAAGLRLHMKYHMGTPDYKCNECDKAFFQKVELIAHQSVHTGVKPFACHVCEYSTCYKQSLKGHLRTHQPKE